MCPFGGLALSTRSARAESSGGGGTPPRPSWRITSKAPEGQPRTGTGFIVRVDGELIYIATASHVVEGDPKPQVTFYHDKRRPVAAEIGALEVDNATAGLGYLIVRDRGAAEKVKALGWSTGMLRGGEDVLAIGLGEGWGSGVWSRGLLPPLRARTSGSTAGSRRATRAARSS